MTKVASVFKKKGTAKPKKAATKKTAKKTASRKKSLTVITRGTATLGSPTKRRKYTKTAKHRRTHLSGVADLLGIQNQTGRKVADGLTTILLVGGGAVVGGLIGKGIDLVTQKVFKMDTTAGWKKFIKPGVLTAIGTVGVIFLKKGETKQDAIQGMIRKLSIGVAVSGGVSLVDAITGKNLLGDMILGKADIEKNRADYYKVAEETMKKINEAQNFIPELTNGAENENPENENLEIEEKHTGDFL